jgi:hypothetical protein
MQALEIHKKGLFDMLFYFIYDIWSTIYHRYSDNKQAKISLFLLLI